MLVTFVPAFFYIGAETKLKTPPSLRIFVSLNLINIMRYSILAVAALAMVFSLFSCLDDHQTVEIDQMDLCRDINLYGDDVEEEILRAALTSYGSQSCLPALTVAFMSGGEFSSASLESNWSFQIATKDPYTRKDNTFITNADGFAFIEEQELLQFGDIGDEFHIDNRQGDSFDYFCGPLDIRFTYGASGDKVFILRQLWCE